jgi:hypothetical protein
MKRTISRYDFHRAFEQMRPDNFTYAALDALFDHFEQYEEDTGEQVELDVIGICCDYAEMTTDEFIESYSLDVDDDATDERKMHEVCEYIQHHSSLVGTFDNTVVFCSEF